MRDSLRLISLPRKSNARMDKRLETMFSDIVYQIEKAIGGSSFVTPALGSDTLLDHGTRGTVPSEACEHCWVQETRLGSKGWDSWKLQGRQGAGRLPTEASEICAWVQASDLAVPLRGQKGQQEGRNKGLERKKKRKEKKRNERKERREKKRKGIWEFQEANVEF